MSKLLFLFISTWLIVQVPDGLADHDHGPPGRRGYTDRGAGGPTYSSRYGYSVSYTMTDRTRSEMSAQSKFCLILQLLCNLVARNI